MNEYINSLYVALDRTQFTTSCKQYSHGIYSSSQAFVASIISRSDF